MSESLHRVKILLLVALPILGVVAALTLLWQEYVFPLDLVLLAVFYSLTVLGITVGYHRMLTHEGFTTYVPLRALFLILGCMAFEGSPTDWASTHIKHHAHSDDEEDPHSPLEGFWHAHFGWLFSKASFPEVEEYAPHLLKDRTVMLVDRLTPLWITLSLAIPFALGGWTGFLWGGLVRIFLVNHVTWSVNSICHSFGRRSFETTDESRNEWIVGLLAFGEGWHNNHHAFPRNAFHGMRWWQFDLSGLLIRALEAVGLIWNVERVKEDLVIAHQMKAETSCEAIQRLRGELMTKIVSAKKELDLFLQKPFHDSLHSEQLSEILTQAQYAMARLEEIQGRIARAHHLRKQKLLAYAREVSDLVQRVKFASP